MPPNISCFGVVWTLYYLCPKNLCLYPTQQMFFEICYIPMNMFQGILYLSSLVGSNDFNPSDGVEYDFYDVSIISYVTHAVVIFRTSHKVFINGQTSGNGLVSPVSTASVLAMQGHEVTADAVGVRKGRVATCRGLCK